MVILGLAALGGTGVRYARSQRRQGSWLDRRLQDLSDQIDDVSHRSEPQRPTSASADESSLVPLLVEAIVEQNKAILEVLKSTKEGERP